MKLFLIVIFSCFWFSFFPRSFVFALDKEVQPSFAPVECKMDHDQKPVIKISEDLTQIESSAIKPVVAVRKSNEEVIRSYLCDPKIKEKILVLGCDRTTCRKKKHGYLGELTLNWDSACDADLLLDVTDIWKKDEKISERSKIFQTIVDEDCCPIPIMLDEAADVEDAANKKTSKKSAKKLLTHLHELLVEDGLFVETVTGCGHNNSDQRASFIEKTGLFREIRDPLERYEILKKTVFNQSADSIDLEREQVQALCLMRDKIKKYTDFLEGHEKFLKKDIRKRFSVVSKKIPEKFQSVIKDILDCIAYTQMIQITGDHSLSTQEMDADERMTVKKIKDRLRVLATPPIKKYSLTKQIIHHNDGDETMYCVIGEQEYKLMNYLNSFCTNQLYGLYRRTD